jgi:hypothetical protein
VPTLAIALRLTVLQVHSGGNVLRSDKRGWYKEAEKAEKHPTLCVVEMELTVDEAHSYASS